MIIPIRAELEKILRSVEALKAVGAEGINVLGGDDSSKLFNEIERGLQFIRKSCKTVKTGIDYFGMQHIEALNEYVGHVTIDTFASQAISLRRTDVQVCWFWYHGYPALVHPGDTRLTLVTRWTTWKKQCEDQSLLYVLATLRIEALRDTVSTT